jgi:hypothetical protein
MAINGNFTLWSKSQLKGKNTNKANGEHLEAQNYKKFHRKT